MILGMLVFFHTIIHAQEDFLSSFEQEYSTQDISDPLYHYNHFMHAVNWNVYDYALSPLLETYNKSIPLGYRLGIYNFFDNLASTSSTFPCGIKESLNSKEWIFKERL